MPVNLNQKGFSLPEIMIALGLLGGISVVTIRLIENQANNEAHLKAKAEIQKATALLKTVLNDPENCRNMLKDQEIPAVMTTPETRTNVSLPPTLPTGSANPALPAGPGLYQRVKLPTTPVTYAYREMLAANAQYGLFRTGDIQFAKTSDSNTPTEILNPAAMNIDTDSVDLVISFRLESKSILNAFRSDGNNANDKTFTQRLPLMVTFNYANNRIKDCGLVLSESNVAAKQKFCESLGSNMARWDAPTQRCNFIGGNTCPAGQIPRRQFKESTNSTRLFECHPISEQFKAEDLFDTTAFCHAGPGGFSVVTGASGKLTIKCN